MKIWKKILIVNLAVLLAIMGFFVWLASFGFNVEVEEFDHYEGYQKLMRTTYGPYIATIFQGITDDYDEVAVRVEVYLYYDIVDNPKHSSQYGGWPQGKMSEGFWINYVEVYGKAVNGSYILLDNRSRTTDRQIDPYYEWLSPYDNKHEFTVCIWSGYRKDIIECPLLMENPRYEIFESQNVIKYDADVYIVAYFDKPVYVKKTYTAYGYVAEQIYDGLYYSSIATVIIWALTFIVWVITRNVTGFVKWLKR